MAIYTLFKLSSMNGEAPRKKMVTWGGEIVAKKTRMKSEMKGNKFCVSFRVFFSSRRSFFSITQFWRHSLAIVMHEKHIQSDSFLFFHFSCSAFLCFFYYFGRALPFLFVPFRLLSCRLPEKAVSMPNNNKRRRSRLNGKARKTFHFTSALASRGLLKSEIKFPRRAHNRTIWTGTTKQKAPSEW